TRFVEDLDAVRERSQIIQDELTTALSDKLNRNLYLLSIVAAIFLPLGFLTGLLGINVGGIPGTESPYAFGIFSAILVLIVGLQVVIFRKLHWI
ncbi:MAG TPA: zinc transporter ZntB, partial [Alphaproteobacteria bacterium]|nr:zinc transporter ZntB [Alphaproteobacteria bacterium]